MLVPDKKCKVKASKRPKTRRSSESDSDGAGQKKEIKLEEVTKQLVSPWTTMAIETSDCRNDEQQNLKC